MKSVHTIIASLKETALQRYLANVNQVDIPESVLVAEEHRPAFLAGLKLGRRLAYEEGLVDGVQLGLELEFILEDEELDVHPLH